MDPATRTSLFASLVLGALLGGLAGLGACFIESPQPSSFRYSCEAVDECEDGQDCANGLCQDPCGGADDPACPSDAPVCINGYCSSICPTDQDVCPDPQECLSLAAPGEEVESGICAVPCDPDTAPCADGELCLEGYCAATCMSDADCVGGSCALELGGICIPEIGGGSGGGFF